MLKVKESQNGSHDLATGACVTFVSSVVRFGSDSFTSTSSVQYRRPIPAERYLAIDQSIAIYIIAE